MIGAPADASASAAPWPPGWGLRLDPATRRIDGGRVLVGGAPRRVMRLSATGATWLDRIERGEPVPAGATSSGIARRLVDGGLAHPVPSALGGPTPDEVAVVIPVRDDPVGLAQTLDALAGIDGLGPIVVVDDGSVDRVAVERAAGTASVLRHARARGPGAARQTGWLAVDRPIVAFVDAGVVVERTWLAHLLPHLADLALAAIAPRVRSRAGEAPRQLAAYEAARSPLDLGGAAAPVRPGSPVPYVPTAALVVRREALVAVDGFDPGLRYGEDVDLVWRLHDTGWRVRYEPAARATHASRSTYRAWLRQRVGYGSSAAGLAARHGDAVAPLRGLSGWSALAWGAALTGHPVLGAVIAAGSSTALVPKLSTLEHPLPEAARLAGTGHLWAGRAVAEAVRRTWWPLALGLGALDRRARPALLACALMPPALEWRATRPGLGLGRYAALRLADDAAYGAGVWLGCARARSGQALRPAFSGPIDVDR